MTAKRPVPPGEVSRRARILSTRMPSLRSMSRLRKAAKLAGISVHAFCLQALENHIEQTIALDSSRRYVARSRRTKGLSNITAEYAVTISGGRSP
jgi:hypothetical protein